jgi:hypothetical protein
MTTLQEEPWNLIQNDLVQARVQAANENGWGEVSEMNIVGGTISVKPYQMMAPTRGQATTTASLEVFWVALEGTETGDSPIDSYNLQWDKNTIG